MSLHTQKTQTRTPTSSAPTALPWVAVCLLLGVGENVDAASFQGLGELPRVVTVQSAATAVSYDGVAIVGTVETSTGRSSFIWTDGSGTMSPVPVGGSSVANGVANGASHVVGHLETMAGPETYFHPSAGPVIGLGDLPGGQFSSTATGISADGQVMAGTGHSDFGSEAFRVVDPPGSLEGLGFLPNGFTSQALNVSADGTVIVGSSTTFSAIGGEAFRWTQSSGMFGLGDLPGGATESVAYATSANGLVTVGSGTSAFGTEAFRHTGAGMVSLGDLPGGEVNSVARAVSGSGATIVGEGRTSNANSVAFIWDPQQGMRALKTVLIDDFGLGSQLSGWHLVSATGISGDGQVIAGAGINPDGEFEAWRAELDSGTINAGDYSGNDALDAADYTVWRDSLGDISGSLPNDANGGIIGSAQYETWKENFATNNQNALLGNVHVPEPAGGPFMLAGFLFFSRRALRARRRVGQGGA